jgi:hypothetical protein
MQDLRVLVREIERNAIPPKYGIGHVLNPDPEFPSVKDPRLVLRTRSAANDTWPM